MKPNEDEPLIGLVLTSKKDKEKLLQLCLTFDIPILYPHLFTDDKYHRLWAFNSHGIGLVGTVIMRTLKKVIHGIDELELWLLFGDDE